MTLGEPVACGGNGESGVQEACYFYNTADDAWTSPTNMLAPRSVYAIGQLNTDDFWVLGQSNNIKVR